MSRQIQNHMRMQRVSVDTLVRHVGGKPKERLTQGSRVFTPASTDDTVRAPSYTPLRGLVTGAEMLEFRDVQASLDSVMPGCSLLWLQPSPFLPYPATFGGFIFYN